MAKITFFLRGEGENSTVFYRYRPARDLNIRAATPYKINSENWSSENECWNTSQIKKGAKSAETQKQNAQIENFNRDLLHFRVFVESLINANLSLTGGALQLLLKDEVKRKYFAHRIVEKNSKDKFPQTLAELIDFYIDYRSVADVSEGTKPLAANTVKKYVTLKNVLNDFRKKILVADINDAWKKNFISHLEQKNYSANTQFKFVKDVKMLCKFASEEFAVSPQVLRWKIIHNSKIENVSDGVTFTFAQLQILSETRMPTDYLENAKDWLLISCYTSVRVSELMTFDTDNLLHHGDDLFLKVHEKKTGNKKIVYLLPQVVEIMKKRGGNFPRKISDQRYNGYIKEVCKVAGFTEPTPGAKAAASLHKGKKIIRKEKGIFPFCELVTSHSGRRTYVTLFSEYLPAEILQLQTNHHSREMVAHYNKTDETELMLRSARMVANAHKEVKLKIV